ARARLALCSRKLNHISTRHLYGNIPALSPSSMLVLLHLLHRKPDYATRVCWPGLITQELKFPFQLHHFDTNFELNHHLALFLHTQPHIKLFVLTDQEYNLSTLKSFLDITHLEQLSFGICGNDARLHVLFLLAPSESLQHIQVEKLNDWDIESLRDFLDHLSHCTPNLEWLILMNLSGGKESFRQESLELVGRYLHPFKHLFHFLCLNMVANKADLGSEQIRSILKQWSDACLTLCSVGMRMLPLWKKGSDNQPWLSSKPS
ncbi:hypothetical protein BT96DRAFT_929537, partial [Gymnopus androsaceus JB14]